MAYASLTYVKVLSTFVLPFPPATFHHLLALMPVVNEQGVLKLDNKARTGPGKQVSEPWRQRKPAIKQPEEELAKKQRERDEKKEKMNEAINFAREYIWGLMECLHDDFPEHTADWFYQLIMQQPKWKKKQRAVSPWNAFLSLKVPEYNDGTS